MQAPPFSAPMAYSNSKVWVSPREATHDRWIAVKENLSRVRFDRSPFVPQIFAEYVDHLATQAEDSAKAEKQRLADLEALQIPAGAAQHPWIIPFEGKKFGDNLSPVLSMPSVWSPWYEFTNLRPEAPWPSPEEFKEEGDERHTSGFGRFLPVPRTLGNETVNYKQKAFMAQYPLDFVNPVLCREPTPRFAQEEENALADKLMMNQQIGFRAEKVNRNTLNFNDVAHPAVQVQTSGYAHPKAEVEASTLCDFPPTLEVEVDSANEDEAEEPVAEGAEEMTAADGHVTGISLAGDRIENQLVRTEARDFFQAHILATAAKEVEPLKGFRLVSSQEYAETTVEEDNETIVSESTLDNGMTMIKNDKVKDILVPVLES